MSAVATNRALRRQAIELSARFANIGEDPVIQLNEGQGPRVSITAVLVLGGQIKLPMFIFHGLRIIGKERRAGPGGG